MSGNRRIFFVVVGMLLLLSLVVGCKKDKDKDEGAEAPTQTVSQDSQSKVTDSEEQTQASSDLIDEEYGTTAQEGTAFGTLDEAPKWDFDMSANFETWDSEMPFINPMGNKEAYSEILYSEDSGGYFEYLDDNNMSKERAVYGETYLFKVPFDEDKTKEDNLSLLKDIEAYIDGIDGIIIGDSEDKVLFVADDDEENHWWCGVLADDDHFEMTIVKERELKLGETMKIDTSKYEEHVIRFTSYHDGKNNQTMTSEIHQGLLNLNIYKEDRYGAYSRSYNYSMMHESEHGFVAVHDDAMLDGGVYYWEVSWYEDEDDPGEIILTLESNVPLPEVTMGEALGAVVVSASESEGIHVWPTGRNNLYLDHPEIDSGGFNMDLTPDGDYMMYVPSGFWDVEILPNDNSDLAAYVTRMVPVNAGEITTVHVPLAYERNLNEGGNDSGMRGLAMEEPVAEGDNVVFNFSLVDTEIQDVLPSSDNTTITEGGEVVNILSIDRIEAPPSVVLLLDSSGSMKGQMDVTLDAARTFIEGLPDETWLTVIDFDTKPKILDGTTKEEGLNSLSSIRVDGATALYDSLIEGYTLLEGRSRPTMVVFTDGTDANYNDTAPGSVATYEEVLAQVGENTISMYTIGFGEGHDGATLKDLADKSAGLYYSAEDDSALWEVFDAINSKLNNSFKVTYERPKASTPSDIPMVSFVIDVSGSMFSDPSDGDGGGWRLDDVKNMYHDFILELPEDAQMQLMSFSGDVIIEQSSTINKTRILRALGELDIDYTTNIIGSVSAGYTTLDMMPSTKKVLIYLTDAALGVDDADQATFDTVLESMAEKDLNVLWVGIGIEDETPFVYAAEKSGGRYVITEDFDALRKTFDEAIAEAMKTKSMDHYTNVRIDVEKVAEDGTRKPYTANRIKVLPPLPLSDQVSLAETITYTTGKSLKQYDLTSAKLVSGKNAPGESTKITKRMDLDVASANEAINIQVKELYYLSSLDGVAPPAGYRYMAVELSIDHILPLQEMMVYPEGTGHPASWVGGGQGTQGTLKKVKVPYMIPDFKSHFFMTYNNTGAYPASSATWLTNKPLPVPGNLSITLAPDDNQSGMLVFAVPEEATEQCSLHFYDTGYGHIDLPLIGVMQRRDVEIDALPTVVTSTLNDTFEFTVKGTSDVWDIMGNEAAEEGSVFRMVEGDFDTKVQALININPLERFFMRFPTDSGDFYVPLNPVTAMVPFGFAQPRMLAPGSFNYVRWVFGIPEGLQENACEIFIELAGGDGVVEVSDGSNEQAGARESYSHEFFDLAINSYYTTEDVAGSYGNWLVVDVTIKDKKDGFATSGLENLFYLQKDDVEEDTDTEYSEESKGLSSFGTGNSGDGSGGDGKLRPDGATDDQILGLGEEAIVYDGTERRGFVLFNLSELEVPENYTLMSSLIDGLALKPGDSDHNDALFANKKSYDIDGTYAEALSEAVDTRVSFYKASHPETAEELVGGTALEEEQQQSVPAPALTGYGQSILEAIKTEEALWNLLSGLTYTADVQMSIDQYTMSSEAVVTQNAGTATEMAHLAHEALCRLGYKPSYKQVSLTDTGKELLSVKAGYETKFIDEVPAVAYKKDNGKEKVMVMPFVKNLSELDDIAYMKDFDVYDMTSMGATITVSVLGEAIGGAATDVAVDVVDALGGDDEVDHRMRLTILEEQLTTEELSRDAIDVLMVKVNNELGAAITSAGGDTIGSDPVSLFDIKVESIEVAIHMDGEETWVHRVAVDDTIPADKVFMTFSLNAPALTLKAAKALETKNEQVRNLVDDPDSLTAMRWYTRSMLNNFLFQQNQIEASLNEVYEMSSNHVNTERGSVITLRLGEELKTSIDLLETNVDLYTDNNEAKRSYRIIHGLNMSTLESAVLKDGVGLAEIWSSMPENGSILVLNTDDIDTDEANALMALGMKPSMVTYLQELGKYIMIQSKPSMIDGEEHWAWYEVDPDDYKTVSVLDTGEHGAMTSEAVIQTGIGVAQYAVGAFKGVEASVWAVAVYSLEETDYDLILKKAKALCLGIAENFNALDPQGMLKELAKKEAQKAADEALQRAGIDMPPSSSWSTSVPGLPKTPAKEDYMGYQNGFKAGVDYYFSVAN